MNKGILKLNIIIQNIPEDISSSPNPIPAQNTCDISRNLQTSYFWPPQAGSHRAIVLAFQTWKDGGSASGWEGGNNRVWAFLFKKWCFWQQFLACGPVLLSQLFLCSHSISPFPKQQDLPIIVASNNGQTHPWEEMPPLVEHYYSKRLVQLMKMLLWVWMPLQEYQILQTQHLSKKTIPITGARELNRLRESKSEGLWETIPNLQMGEKRSKRA